MQHGMLLKTRMAREPERMEIVARFWRELNVGHAMRGQAFGAVLARLTWGRVHLRSALNHRCRRQSQRRYAEFTGGIGGRDLPAETGCPMGCRSRVHMLTWSRPTAALSFGRPWPNVLGLHP